MSGLWTVRAEAGNKVQERQYRTEEAARRSMMEVIDDCIAEEVILFSPDDEEVLVWSVMQEMYGDDCASA